MTAHCTLRLARRNEIRDIAVMSRCLVELGLRGWSWHPARVARALHGRDSCVVVADAGRRLAGFAIAEFGDSTLHLSLLAVQPAWQRCGIGSALVDWLQCSALTAGINRIDVEMRANNFAARCFYSTLGFSPSGEIRGYYQNIETAIRMCKHIGHLESV